MNEKTNETGPASGGGLPLPIDERRLKSIASDIARGWAKDLPEVEKRAMMWAIERFHALLVDGTPLAQPPAEPGEKTGITAEVALMAPLKEAYAIVLGQGPGETPRTDAAEEDLRDGRIGTGNVLDRMRVIERENAALAGAIQEANWTLSRNVDAGGGMVSLRDWLRCYDSDRSARNARLKSLRGENAALSAEVERLRGLLREMADANNVDDPCQYDDDGRCQSHWLHERPCLAERVREALADGPYTKVVFSQTGERVVIEYDGRWSKRPASEEQGRG